jgi:hypothetical protein
LGGRGCESHTGGEADKNSEGLTVVDGGWDCDGKETCEVDESSCDRWDGGVCCAGCGGRLEGVGIGGVEEVRAVESICECDDISGLKLRPVECCGAADG